MELKKPVLYGYQGKWLRVNLTNGAIEDQVFEGEVLKKFLGSSAMGAKILYEETDSETNPLGPENVLIFATGVLNNTRCICGGRYQVIAKSPLTGAFGEGNSGGKFGPMLKRAGYDGVIITGKADKPVYLSIIEGVAKLNDASDLWGLDSFETSDKLKMIYGQKAVIACIGQGGEHLVKYAAIINDGVDARCVGRSGMGAVMGSKNLKALVVFGTASTPIKYEKELNEDIKTIARNVAPGLKINPMRKYGTPIAWSGYIGIGEIPIKNWQLGTMENIEYLDPTEIETKMEVSSYFCSQCIIGCGRTAHVKEGKYASIKTGGLEYETLAMLGANLLINDVQALQMGNELCNRYGIDTISCGGAIAWAMEAYEYGLITKEDTKGLELTWGNVNAMLELIRKISFREGIGDILAEGCAGASKIIGKGSEAFAVHIRGMDLPAHDPRAHVSSAIAYLTTPRGACHQAGAHSAETKPNGISSIRFNKELVPGRSKNMGAWVAELQNAMNMIDSLGACKMAQIVLGSDALAKYAHWVSLITGWNMSVHDLAEVGERIHNIKWLYNLRMGVSRMDMILPPRISTRKRGQGGNAHTLPMPDLMLSDYFYQRGWSEFGIPLPETLERLAISEYFPNDLLVGPPLFIG